MCVNIIQYNLYYNSRFFSENKYLIQMLKLVNNNTIKITANNVFDIDFSFIYNILGVILSYLIVILQLN